jgi:DNA-binding NtrC family response regulator
VDVRVLATTNRDLAKAVEAKEFRQDLYYRLNVIPLRLPALRERGNDVLLLADYFVSRFALMYSLGKISISEEAKKWLLAHDWPGNVRELQNLMERAALLCAGSSIEPRHFLLDENGDWQDEAVKTPGCNAQGAATAVLETAPTEHSSELASDVASVQKISDSQLLPADSGKKEEILPLHEVERRLIFKSLNHTAGNRTQAAVLLGISVRTLRNKLNEYRKIGLEVP